MVSRVSRAITIYTLSHFAGKTENGKAAFGGFDHLLPVAARGATKPVAPVRRREHTLSVFTKTPPHPAFAGMTSRSNIRRYHDHRTPQSPDHVARARARE